MIWPRYTAAQITAEILASSSTEISAGKPVNRVAKSRVAKTGAKTPARTEAVITAKASWGNGESVFARLADEMIPLGMDQPGNAAF